MTPRALAALHARCFASPPPWSEASFLGFLDDPTCFLLVDPSSHGFLLGRVAAQEAEILTIATDPSHRRTGIARGLMAAFEVEARHREAETAFLEVAETNAAARALYAACGFTEAGRRPGYYVAEGGARIAAMILCKSLA
ncbi:GNAT family N-acetyltransferase [Pararhodobacter oceanensis]|uniref:GNAT family N-acetyltransferase n=1 Tax=Pararhodobacter oceanensis TaxID=2172121 RepID=UPI003A950D7D